MSVLFLGHEGGARRPCCQVDIPSSNDIASSVTRANPLAILFHPRHKILACSLQPEAAVVRVSEDALDVVGCQATFCRVVLIQQSHEFIADSLPLRLRCHNLARPPPHVLLPVGVVRNRQDLGLWMLIDGDYIADMTMHVTPVLPKRDSLDIGKVVISDSVDPRPSLYHPGHISASGFSIALVHYAPA